MSDFRKPKPPRRTSEISRAGGTARYRAEVAARLTNLLEAAAGASAGWMFGFPTFYSYGRMFACAYGSGVGIKLPAEKAANLIAAGNATAFGPHDRAPMREWVQIDRTSPRAYDGTLPLLLESAAFVSPQPQPRTRRCARPQRRQTGATAK